MESILMGSIFSGEHFLESIFWRAFFGEHFLGSIWRGAFFWGASGSTPLYTVELELEKLYKGIS